MRRLRSGQRDTMQLAVVILLDDETAHHSNAVRNGIYRKYGRNPALDAHPHITLKMGFPAQDTAPFENFVEQIAANTAPFEVSLRDFGFFDEGILFLNVEPNHELENLRQRVLTGLLEQYGVTAEVVEGPQFHFHVTLAYGLSKRDFAELKESFSQQELRVAFQAKHINLFRHTGRQWVTCNRAPLCGVSSSSPNPLSRQSWNPN